MDSIRSTPLIAIAAIAAVIAAVALWQVRQSRRDYREQAQRADAAVGEARDLRRQLTECRAAERLARRSRTVDRSAVERRRDSAEPRPGRREAVAPHQAGAESPEFRDTVRADLERRFASSFDDDELDADTRTAAIELLLRFRDLRREIAAADEGEAPDLRSRLREIENDIIDQTGMGVSELLAETRKGEPGVSLRPEEATAPGDGEVRKRFEDEIAVQLGIAEPGSVEVREGGEWREAP